MNKLTAGILFYLGLGVQLQAQCVSWQLHPDKLFVPCGTTCTQATASLPDFKSTAHYKAEEISYAPFAFNGAGTELTQLYLADNRYSAVQSIGFPVSFYGNNYSSFVVGNNGVVSFDAGLAGCSNAAVLTNGAQPQTLPYNGGAACGPVNAAYYPKAAIFAYHNLDASAPGGPNKRIEWRTEGAAPCRKLIISFHEVALQGTTCGGLWSSFQVVLHEHSGVIDLFIKDKPTCANGTDNLGLLGLQNATQTAAITLPGKNATVWAEQQTAYRFIPDGPASLWQSATLEKNSSTQATAQLTGTVPGELQVKFSPYCFAALADTLQLLGRYNTATGNGSFTVSDTVFLNKNTQSLSFTTTVIKSVCTNANGAITVHLPPLADPAQYVYAINQLPFQSSNQFTGLAPGNYTIKVKDVSDLCQSRQVIQVADTNPLTANHAVINATCVGLLNGSITATAANGTAPYRYSFDGGGFGANNFFTGLAPGTYVIKVLDAAGCTRTDDVIVRPGTAVAFTNSTTAAYCANTSTGSLTVQMLSGTPPFQFSLNNGPFQSSPTFNHLPPVTQVVTVKDALGCTVTNGVMIPLGGGLTVNTSSVNASCYTADNGSIRVNVTGGVPPYLYSLNSLPFQPTNLFTGLRPGVYTILIQDDLGCARVVEQAVLTNSGTVLDAAMTPPFCSTTSNGSIVVSVSGGLPPYEYKLNNGNYQPGNTFTQLPPGYYIITVRDAAGCVNVLSKELLPGEPFNYVTTATNSTCTNDTAIISVINITPGGVPPYQYAVSQTGFPVYQNSNVMTVTGQGSFLVYVKDARGCVVIKAEIVQQQNTILMDAVATPGTCNRSADGQIEVVTNNNGQYQFSISGTAFQPNNVFTGLIPETYKLFVKYGFCVRDIELALPPGPAITVTADVTPESCLNNRDGQIILIPVWAHAPVTYSLTPQPFQPNNVYSGLAAGIYKLVAKDALGCTTDTLFPEVTIAPLFEFTTQVTPAKCQESNNGRIAITVTSPGTYQFSINNGPWQSTPVFDNLGAGAYRLAIQNAAGCKRNALITVTAGTGVAATATITQPITCTQPTGTITVTVSNAEQPVLVSMNNGPYGSNTVFSGLPVGNYIFRVKDASNCTAIATASLVIPPEPLLQLATNQPCNGLQDGGVSAIVSGGTAPFNYSFNNSPFATASHIAATAGIYRVTVKDALDCQATAIINLLQMAPVRLDAQLQHAGCTGSQSGSVTLTPRGDGSVFEYSVNNSGFSATNPLALQAGVYSIVAKDEFGCLSSPLAITLGAKNGITLAIPPDTVVCEGLPFLLNTSSNASQFNWQPAMYLNNNQAQSPVTTPLTTTSYTVTATLGHCQLSRFVTIGVKPAPVANAGRDTMVCFGQPWPLQGSGGATYQWRPATGLSNANIPNPVFTGSQTTTYYLTVTGANGCPSLREDTLTLTRLQAVPAYAGDDTLVLAGQPHQLQASGGAGYSWSPVFYLNDAAIANPLAVLTQDQRYTVTVTDVNGCRGSDDIMLKIYRPLLFPSAFSPNNDGVNDRFAEASGNSMYNYTLRVYNRFGQLVFETHTPGQGWDGNFKGVQQAAGTYVYQAEAYDGYLKKQVQLKGTVILVR